MVETVEQITNSVESAAEKLHEVAEHIEESLPQGKLRNVFDFIENTAEEIAKGADVAGDLIDKVSFLPNTPFQYCSFILSYANFCAYVMQFGLHIYLTMAC